MSLLVIGNTVVDLILPDTQRLAAWPEHTEFTADNLVLLDNPPIVTVGGNGANAAYVAARCGTAVTLQSNLGADTLGRIARDWLTQAGCRLPDSPLTLRTPVNLTVANSALQRATYFYPGATPELPKEIDGAAAILIAGWPHPPIQQTSTFLRHCSRRDVRTVLDVGPFIHAPPPLAEFEPVLQHLNVFIANAHELLTLTDQKTQTAAISLMREIFSGDLIIKLGADGAAWYAAASETAFTVEAPPVRAVNTVGAGDSFNGALLAALDRGVAMTAALEFANAVAASVVASPQGVLGMQLPE